MKGRGMERNDSIVAGNILSAGKIYKKSYTALLLTACFVIPAAVMLVTYAFYGMAPFGENSVLIMDMSNQYCEFYCGLKHIGSMGDLFFNWSKALGGNYIGVFAYYLSSPLSVFTLLWPNTEMPICLMYLTCLKIGLCGFTFGIFLNKRHQRKGCKLSRVYIALFATCYAMMSYNIVYSLSLMWIDAVLWLPLIMLGIENLVHEGRWGLLVFSFAGIFISTYYISYMAGIFSCMYLLFALAEKKGITKKFVGKTILKFVGSAAAAGGIGAWLLVPTFFSLLQGKIGGSNYTNPDVTYYKLTDLIKKMVIGTYDGITIRVTPFLYCGIIVFIFFFAFFFLRSIRRNVKIVAASIIIFLILSTYFVRVDWAWHIFQLPNWFPYRYSFTISFMMILAAAEAFTHFKEIKYTHYCIFTVLAISVYLVFYLEPHLGITKQQIRFSMIFLLFSVVFLVLLRYLPIRMRLRRQRIETYAIRGAIWFLIFSLTFCELCVHANFLLHGLDSVHDFESYESYHQYKKRMEELVRVAEEDDENTGGDGFYRVGQGFQRNFNEGIGMGYQSISHFSSAYNRHINMFLRQLGFAQAYLWSSYAGSTVVTDALFSVKYVMTDKDIQQNDPERKVITWNPMPMTQYESVRKYDSTILYRNPYSLKPLYAASNRIQDFEWGANPLESQNNLLNALIGEEKEYFTKLTKRQEYTESKATEKTTYIITMPSNGPLYAYLPRGSEGESPTGTPMIVNGTYRVNLYSSEMDCTMFLGNYNKGDVVTVEIVADADHLKTSHNKFYVMNMPEFEAAIEKLREGEIKLTDWGPEYIRGGITAKANQVIFTGITYDEGWSVYIDGKKTEGLCFQDGLLYFNIPPGEHEIELKYAAQGEKLGIAASGVSCVAVIGYAVVSGARRRKRIANQ